jgi:hypothetical protein
LIDRNCKGIAKKIELKAFRVGFEVLDGDP